MDGRRTHAYHSMRRRHWRRDASAGDSAVIELGEGESGAELGRELLSRVCGRLVLMVGPGTGIDAMCVTEVSELVGADRMYKGWGYKGWR